MTNWKEWMDKVAKQKDELWKLYVGADITCEDTCERDFFRVHIYKEENLLMLADAVDKAEEVVKIENNAYIGKQFDYGGCAWFVITDHKEE